MKFGPNEMYAVLEALGVERTDTNAEQMEVMLEAFGTFIARNEVYRDLWKEGGASDSLHHCKSKVARMDRAVNNHVMTDSAVDLINYTVFFIRNLKEDR